MASSGVNRVLETLFRLVLHGTPSDSQRQSTLEMWLAHDQDSEADGLSTWARFRSAVGTGVEHMVWRVLHGPPTLVIFGLMVFAVGAAATAYVVVSFGASLSWFNGTSAVGAAAFGWAVLRHPSRPRPAMTTVGAIVFAASLVLSTVELVRNRCLARTVSSLHSGSLALSRSCGLP